MKAGQLMWMYLLKHGQSNVEWSYYSSGYSSNKKGTQEALIELQKNGINWKKTKEPSDRRESVFNGTFAEEAEYTSVLEGALVPNEGKKYEFKCKFDEPENVFIIVAELINMKCESVEALLDNLVLKMI